MTQLEDLAKLIREHNRIGHQIAAIIQRPALTSHLGEFLAAQVFDIELAVAANHPGSDGIFRSGPLAAKSVNVRTYTKRESLDLCVDYVPDLYLALTGPLSTASTSRRTSRPFVITNAYLFDARVLHATLALRKRKSIKSADWKEAEIYPEPRSELYSVSEAQRGTLALFAPHERIES